VHIEKCFGVDGGVFIVNCCGGATDEGAGCCEGADDDDVDCCGAV